MRLVSKGHFLYDIFFLSNVCVLFSNVETSTNPTNSSDSDLNQLFLVIGGSGFIGKHIVDYLLEKNHKVTLIF